MNLRAGDGGVQEPRIKLVPKSVSNDSGHAIFLSSEYGLVPDEWQQLVLDGWLGRRRDEQWSAPRAGLAVPRQNGKNAILEIRELYGMVALGEKFLHTAHEVKTARKAFARLLSFFDNERQFPELAALVKDIRRTNGQEAIYLINGGSVEFIARSKGSGRGFTVDVLVMDEAQELSDDALAALLPTVSAAPLRNPQLIFTGTPPAPSMTGEVFTRMRDTGVEGKDSRLCWIEWSCKGELDLDDRALWAQANPGLGYRLSLEATSDERAQMDDETFARERLGVWDDGGGLGTAINPHRWAELTDPLSKAEAVSAFGVDVSRDRDWAAIGAAGQRADGTVHVESVAHQVGTGWVVAKCVELNAAWSPSAFIIDSMGPAASLIGPLEDAGLRVEAMTTSDVSQSFASFVDAVTEGAVFHGPQPNLDAAVLAARKRAIGDGMFAFGRKASASDITPIVAVSHAAWGHTQFGAASASAYVL
jgi:phage terminase large subunit-like protein